MRLPVGVCVGSTERLDQFVLPHIDQSLGPLLTRANQTSIASAYNSILDEASGSSNAGLILIHDDVELLPGAAAAIRAALALPDVAVVGAVGGVGVTSIEWWTAPTLRGRVLEHDSARDFGGGTHDVDSIDGLLIGMSPWAIEHLRFDQQSFPKFHGYDADICFQARREGMRVIVADIPARHHPKGTVGDTVAFVQAKINFTLKWFPPKSRWRRVGFLLRRRIAVLDMPRRRREMSRALVASARRIRPPT